MTRKPYVPCVHLNIQPDASGRLIMRKDHAYPCNAPLPDFDKILPACITQAYGYREPRTTNTFKDWCQRCPRYKERTK